MFIEKDLTAKFLNNPMLFAMSGEALASRSILSQVEEQVEEKGAEEMDLMPFEFQFLDRTPTKEVIAVSSRKTIGKAPRKTKQVTQGSLRSSSVTRPGRKKKKLDTVIEEEPNPDG